MWLLGYFECFTVLLCSFCVVLSVLERCHVVVRLL